MDKQLNIKSDVKQGTYSGEMFVDGTSACTCRVNCDVKTNTWQITSWYTDAAYMHQGIGRATLKGVLTEMYHDFGMPKQIEYVWNGAHGYVMDWLKAHFEPVSKLPLAVRKYSEADDWEAHIYRLNVGAVFNYFFGERSQA